MRPDSATLAAYRRAAFYNAAWAFFGGVGVGTFAVLVGLLVFVWVS